MNTTIKTSTNFNSKYGKKLTEKLRFCYDCW